MAYTPSFQDLPSSGYQPTFADLPTQTSNAPQQNINLFSLSSNQNPNLTSFADPFARAAKDVGVAGLNIGQGLLNIPYSAVNAINPSAAASMESNLPNFLRHSNIDFNQTLGVQNPGASDAFIRSAANIIPAIATGGESLLGQSAAYGGLQGIQAPIGHQLSSGVENALGAFGLGKLLPGAYQLVRPVSAQSTAAGIQATHDALSDAATKGFQYVSNEAANRGISQVPSKYINSDLIDQAGSFLSKNKANNSLLDAASSGDYNALRNLQTSLWQKATKAVASDDPAISNQGEEMFDVRDRINDGIYNHLVDSGNQDLANALDNARGNYKQLQDTYYNKNLPRSIPKLVDPDVRKIPDNLLKVLSEYSIPMQNVRNANPFVNNDINSQALKDNYLTWLKRAGIAGGALAAGYHYLKPSAPSGGGNAVITPP